MKHETAERLYQAIFHRKSVRKYSRHELPQETLQAIHDFWNQTERIDTEEPVTMRILSADNVRMRVAMSYNAPYYIAVYASDTEKGLVNAGYMLQQLDLWLSAHGIGSCWLHMMTPDQENAAADGMSCQITMSIGYPDEDMYRSEFGSQIRAYRIHNTQGDDAYRKLHVMDMGIALCHLYLSASHNGTFGGFEREKDITYKKDADYILSVKI